MSTDADRERALAKIKKLLTLARDGRGNVTEAETALRQAQSLMRKYNVNEAEAIYKELAEDQDALINQWVKAGAQASETTHHKRIPDWANFIAVGVAALYDTKVVVSVRQPHGKVLVFCGYRIDVQVACWTYEYLTQCVIREARNFEAMLREAQTGPDALMKFLKEHQINFAGFAELVETSPKGRKGSFRKAMGTTLQDRLYALKKERDAAMRASDGSNTAEGALVLRKVDAVVRRFGPLDSEIGTNPVKYKTDWGRHAGTRKGEAVDLNPNPIAAPPKTPVPLLK